MKVLFLTSGPQTPATRFRILQYVPAFRARGIECVVSHSRPAKYEAYPWLGWRLSEQVRWLSRLLDVLRARMGRFDVAVVEREVFTDASTAIERALRPLVERMILDVDDGVFLKEPEKFTQLAALADTVVCGSRFIADYFRPLNDSVEVIPTVIDTRRYPQKQEFGAECVLGWTGTSSNLPYLLRLKSVLSTIAASRPLKLHVIADRPAGLDELQIPGLDVQFFDWHPVSEMADLRAFDVGLMPLPDVPWAKYKCGLKIVQYFGLGIPAIASPVGVNADLIQDGENGFVASTDEEWIKRLTALLDDPRLRERLGKAGRMTAEESFSVTSQINHWVSVLEGSPDEPSCQSRERQRPVADARGSEGGPVADARGSDATGR
jgi:glycosyltransferase involved in cell wall biosynthesis